MTTGSLISIGEPLAIDRLIVGGLAECRIREITYPRT
jgi:hypothetical protein